VRYADAVATAPPGWARFRAADLGRLSRTTLNLVLSAPLEDAAAALAGTPAALETVAAALPPAQGGRLRALAGGACRPAEREAAAGRLARGLFWYLAYELVPDLWDRLATAEAITPELLADLPLDGGRVLEVGAGSGRLTAALDGRATTLVAVEPSPALRRLLRRRYPALHVVAGVGHRLPVAGGWADVVASCATFGPDPPLGGEEVLAELERCVRPGGVVALVMPERPEWWVERGYAMTRYAAPPVRLAPDLEAFFGPAHPPDRLLLKRVPVSPRRPARAPGTPRPGG
jgi:SAM-dependent methyltransferase